MGSRVFGPEADQRCRLLRWLSDLRKIITRLSRRSCFLRTGIQVRTNYKVVGRMRPINHSRAMKTCPGIWPATIFIESYIDIFFMMNFFLILFIFDIIGKLNVLLNDLEIHNDFAMKNKKNWEWLEMNFYNKKD